MPARRDVTDTPWLAPPRSRRSPITRLLPRARQQVVSASSADLHPPASAAADSAFRSCSSLPVRPREPAGLLRNRRRQRFARRFPKVDEHPSLELLYDFFESFAPPSLTALLEEVENDEGEQEAIASTDEAPVPCQPCYLPASHVGHEPVPGTIEVGPDTTEVGPCATETEVEAEAASPLPPVDDTVVVQTEGDQVRSEIHAEMTMLRHLVQAELREAQNVQEARHLQLQEAVNEVVRVTVALEGRMDAMRVTQQPRLPPRPSVTLFLTLVDFLSSALLLLIAMFISRPFCLLRSLLYKERAAPPPMEQARRASRNWRLSGREFDDPFLGTVAKRISYSAATALTD